MPRRDSVLAKKFRMQCPDCATSRTQRFVNRQIGVVCACGNILGTPRCRSCNTPGDHPHQLNKGRWACIPCKATFTYPRGPKTKRRRAKFTNTKKSKKSLKRVTRRLSQMSLRTYDSNMEKLLAEMLFQKKRQSSNVDGASNAKLVNSVSNLLLSPTMVPERAFTPKTTDVLSYQPEKSSVEVQKNAIDATCESGDNSSDDCDQDSSDEVCSSSCEEMVSESFTNNLSDDDSDSNLDIMDDTWDDIAPVASCMTVDRQ